MRLPGILALILPVLMIPAIASAADRIVAVVNGDVVLESELERRYETIRDQLLARGTRLPSTENLRRQVLERLIVESIELQLAAQTGVRVDDALVDRSLRQLAQENGLTLEGLRGKIEEEGGSWPAFRDEIRREITLRSVESRQVENRVMVTEQEVDRELARAGGGAEQQFLVHHILIAVPESAGPMDVERLEKRAAGVVEDLRKGADFEALAVRISQGRQAIEGGSLGWRGSAELPTLFAEAVPTMQRGEIRGPLRGPGGFHIIRLTDQRGGERNVIVQTHARHILLKSGEGMTADEMRHRLATVEDRLRSGEDFAQIARAQSDDPGSAVRGGDLDWVGPEDVVPEFRQAMDRLAPGEISAPVESRFGWHIIQVIERRDFDNTDEFRRSRAREAIRERKAEEELELWRKRLRDEAYVESRL